MHVENHGSVVLLRTESPDERQWLEDNCQTEPWMWMGNALAVEPRYVGAILAGFYGEDDD